MRSTVFKGCTKPPMMMGVPMTPFAIVFLSVFLISIYTSIFLMLLLPILIFIMRLITKHDDQQFRLLGLKIIFQFKYFVSGNYRFWNSSVYSPITFKKFKKE